MEIVAISLLNKSPILFFVIPHIKSGMTTLVVKGIVVLLVYYAVIKFR